MTGVVLELVGGPLDGDLVAVVAPDDDATTFSDPAVRFVARAPATVVALPVGTAGHAYYRRTRWAGDEHVYAYEPCDGDGVSDDHEEA